MRVLFVARRSRAHVLGGMEDHLHTVATELSRRGHDVLVLTARHPDGIEEETVEGVRWRYLDIPGAPGREWDDTLERAVREAISHERFDVIHSQSTCTTVLLRRPFEGLPPIVLSLHGNWWAIVLAGLYQVRRTPSLRTALKFAANVRAVSRRHYRDGQWWRYRNCDTSVPSRSQLRGARISHLIRTDRLHVVPSGIDAELFRPVDRAAQRVPLGLPPDVPVAVVVGRLDNGKAPMVALEAVARLQDIGDLHLVFVGDGDERAALEARASTLRVTDRVVFTGRIEPAAVATYMAAADVFVFPTLLAEAGPLVIAQAMAVHTPVVASRIGAVPEMLGDREEFGVLVPPGDPDALAAALRRLVSDPELRARMGEAGRRHVLEAMTIGTMTDAMVRVYDAAIARHARG